MVNTGSLHDRRPPGDRQSLERSFLSIIRLVVKNAPGALLEGCQEKITPSARESNAPPAEALSEPALRLRLKSKPLRLRPVVRGSQVISQLTAFLAKVDANLFETRRLQHAPEFFLTHPSPTSGATRQAMFGPRRSVRMLPARTGKGHPLCASGENARHENRRRWMLARKASGRLKMGAGCLQTTRTRACGNRQNLVIAPPPLPGPVIDPLPERRRFILYAGHLG